VTEPQIHTYIIQNTADIWKKRKTKPKTNTDRRPHRISKQIFTYQWKEKDIWDKKQ
jgi:hypothetical protein